MTDIPGRRWHFGIRLLRWLAVSALAAQIATAFEPVDGPGMATRKWLPPHLSMGVIIVAMTVLRLC
ncbi:MAG: hypothetical protein BGN87_03365 [Rhizobiales bacterium 65-79]|nr:hypothetical protein [Hyphomicrobiales bacterium]OJU04824.1 MAG: hypothetical protein BGN87_03365 [Rhizobiales bacterium 65-79]